MPKHGRHMDYRNAYAHLGVESSTPQSAPAQNAMTATSAALESSSFEREARPEKKRSGFAPIAFIVGALAVIYIGGMIAFSLLFYPHTTLDGVEVSLKTEAEVAQEHTESTLNTKLAVSLGEDFSGEITGTSIDLATDGAAYAHSAIATQTPWLWPIQAFRTHTLSFPEKSSFDAEKLHKVVEAMVEEHNATAQAPVDATATYDGTSGTYRLVSAVQGNTLDAEKVEAEISLALVEQMRSVELSEDCYIKPEVLDDDEALQEAIAKVNGMLSATQILTVEGTQVGKVSSQQIGTWVSLADDLSIKVDAEAVEKWTKGDLSRELDTAGTKRSYTLPDGRRYTVSGGTYGWIIDGASLATMIVEALETGESGSIEVPMRQNASKHAAAGEADWGSRWIDVNLTTQHAMLVDGGQILWESDIVSGNLEGDFGTPTGVNAINSNMRCSADTGSQIKLISPFKDEHGDPTYVSYVDWWIPFIEDQFAFHDAPWRTEFGGKIYQSDGSHGCINLPADKAQELYRLVNVGDVVVVHN